MILLECWKKFKRVYLCVSVDAYAELNEFIRFPMKWDKLIANLHTIDQIAKDQSNITIQIHSFLLPSAIRSDLAIDLHSG